MADIPREHYFDLPISDQADLLQSLAPVKAALPVSGDTIKPA